MIQSDITKYEGKRIVIRVLHSALVLKQKRLYCQD